MNDGQKSCEVTTDGRRGFEVLLRKLLSYPRAPAVIVLHWWSPLTQVRNVAMWLHRMLYSTAWPCGGNFRSPLITVLI